MSLQVAKMEAIPEETARVARAAFPKGSTFMQMRDELGSLYEDSQFAALYSTRGQPAAAPWRLMLVCVMQFAEGLSDRQAADAVRSRIDWKYALGLALSDAGFDFSVLSEFRDRLIAGHLEQDLLDSVLRQCQKRGWLKARGIQRTDSTHVLAAIRTVNRLEMVGETLRAALNALASAAPEWLSAQVSADWFERYSRRVEGYRLAKGDEACQRYAAQIGADGFTLLQAVYSETAPAWLREVPAVQTLRRVWVQQYYPRQAEGTVCWRKTEDRPPAAVAIHSPYDEEARYGAKRNTTWTGYKVHLTETCDAGSPHLITQVETTLALDADVAHLTPIQQELAVKEILPQVHLVDYGYTSAETLRVSRSQHQVELVGPIRENNQWQARAEQGYDLPHFQIDWEAQQVVCPQGKTTYRWTQAQDGAGQGLVHASFRKSDCTPCPVRSLCTRRKSAPRSLTLRAQPEYLALEHARVQQSSTEFKRLYAKRAGIEGTLSQGIRAFELRRTRYIGLAKTHLQHVLTAVAMNVVRIIAWRLGIPQTKTRTSRFAALTTNSA